MNFQIFKLVLEKAEEPQIKLPASDGSSKKQESSRKNIYFCFIDYAKAFDCVDHHKLKSSLPGEISTPQIGRWHHPYVRKRRTKEPLDENERGEWKSWLKIQFRKLRSWHLVPSTSWQIDGETMETVTDFIFWAPKSLQTVTAAMKLEDSCSLEEKLWPT